MRLLQSKPAARRGFTLIELLVVIAVIALLVALTAAAVMNLFLKGPEAQDRSDMSAMTAALQQFKAKYGFYPPSRLFLANSLATYTSNAGDPLVADSLATLMAMFPNMSWNGVDWSGGLGMPPTGGVVLEGDQCLVFFLGGIPSSPGGTNACLGFSKSVGNPTQAGGERLKFYEFQPARLTQIHDTPATPAQFNKFFSYVNAHLNKPYAYFSPGRRGQGSYNSTWVTGTAPNTRGTGLGGPPLVGTTPNPYRNSDCNFTAKSLGVNPYASVWSTAAPAAISFINPDSFQLISAGRDGVFGPGTTSGTTVWTPTNTVVNLNGPGNDDISNFHDRNLGVAQ